MVSGWFSLKRKQSLIDKRNNVVVKANDLIQKSRFDLSTQQQKVVLYLISQIMPSDEDFKLYEFNITDFCKVCGIDSHSGKNYADLKSAIKEIADKSLWVTLDDGKETLLRWIEKPYIDKKSGIISIKLDKDMKPFLLQLKENYTQYQLLWTLKFKSKYSIRLYELIKSIHYNELKEYSRTYELTDLKRLLNAENYKTFQHFKDRVLLPAIDEINKTSDKIINYEFIKSGRTISDIKLNIKTKAATDILELQTAIEKEFETDQITFW